MRKFAVLFIILFLVFGIKELIAEGARCYRVFDHDLSTVTAGTTQVEVSAWNGSGEVAFFMNVTGHGYDGTAGQVKAYSEIQDSFWILRLSYEGTGAEYIPLADGYKRCTAGIYNGISANTITGNKVYGNKLWFWYVANGDTSGHLTVDVCVKKD